MGNINLFDGHFMPDGDVLQRLDSGVRLALIHGKESLLRNESDVWHRTYLPKFAAMAAQLRREADRRAEESRPHLALALHFEDMAMQPPQTQRPDEDEGPY